MRRGGGPTSLFTIPLRNDKASRGEMHRLMREPPDIARPPIAAPLLPYLLLGCPQHPLQGRPPRRAAPSPNPETDLLPK